MPSATMHILPLHNDVKCAYSTKFIEEANTWLLIFLFLFELRFSPKEFNSNKIIFVYDDK